jgi:Tol biopolymer transport system component
LRFAPGGARLAYVGRSNLQDTIHVVLPDTTNTAPEAGRIIEVDWSREGSALAFAMDDGVAPGIFAISAAGGGAWPLTQDLQSELTTGSFAWCE